MSKAVAAIILNYKRLDDTITCIKKIKSADTKDQVTNFVVDNTPSTENFESIRQFADKEALYFPSSDNFGFAKAINIGIRQAQKRGYKYILIINPDVQIPKNFFNLLRHFKDDKVGIVAPAIKHKQNGQTMYSLDGKVDWQLAKPEHINKKSLGQNLVKQDCEFVTFACVLLNFSIFPKTGLLDERYFMYCEDVDFCLTVKKKKYKIVLDTSVQVFHETSSSFSIPTQKLKISFVSHLKFINKWLKPTDRIVPTVYQLFTYPYLYLLWTYHYVKNSRKK